MGFLDQVKHAAQDAADKVTNSEAYAKLTSEETQAKLRDAGDAVAHGVTTAAHKAKAGIDAAAARYDEKHDDK